MKIIKIFINLSKTSNNLCNFIVFSMNYCKLYENYCKLVLICVICVILCYLV